MGTKEDVHAYLSKIEQKVKELEVANEAEKIAKKISMDASINKVEEKREELLEKRIKELQDHEEYVKQVIANQEEKKKQYLTNLCRRRSRSACRRRRCPAEANEVERGGEGG